MSTLIDRATVQKMANEGSQLVEVLPAKEYAEDHLPGALSHPLGQLDKEAGEIDRQRPVIVYCWDSA
ncbi:MAG TPA: rhodanese-like domain-containing protein [Candidatus Dormibacteraeota bacterium]